MYTDRLENILFFISSENFQRSNMRIVYGGREYSNTNLFCLRKKKETHPRVQ